jgi:DNA-binding HxlR family transcriptional regulator
MLEPPVPEAFAETLLSDETVAEPGSNRRQEDESTMAALLNLLGKKHTIALLQQFSCDSSLRFTDLEEALDIAPNTLSARLGELTEAGFLTRRAYNEIPPRVEYQSTGKVRDLAPVFWYLGEWTERHDLGSPVSDSEPA